MIGTHTQKLTVSNAKQDAVCSHIISDLDKRYITSKTTNLTQQYFACPRSAGNMREFRELSQAILNNQSEKPKPHLPAVQDGRLVKQLVLPTSDAAYLNDQYVNVSPLESLGLLREVWLRTHKKAIKHQRYSLETTPAAYANHSELLLLQAGRVALLQRGVIYKQFYGEDISQKTTALMLRFDCQNMNICSGFVAHGHPAITAAGGLVHLLERKIQANISFAIGFSGINWNSRRRGTNHLPETIKNKLNKPVILHEMTGSGDIVLLLKTQGDYQQLASEMQNITRFAGGSIFNLQIKFLDNQNPPKLPFLHSSLSDVRVFDSTDALGSALHHYATHNHFSINQVGYAFLENPTFRNNSRKSNYPHAWAEPVYSLFKQDWFSESAYFARKSLKNCIIWESAIA